MSRRKKPHSVVTAYLNPSTLSFEVLGRGNEGSPLIRLAHIPHSEQGKFPKTNPAVPKVEGV